MILYQTLDTFPPPIWFSGDGVSRLAMALVADYHFVSKGLPTDFCLFGNSIFSRLQLDGKELGP